MKLYNYWRSSSSWRVRIALAHKNIDYEYVPIHLVQDGGVQNQDWFADINPSAQVPVLEVDGASLAQSVAIFEYIEEQFPNPPLLPSDAVDRAKTRQLAEIINSGTQPLQNLSAILMLKDQGQDAKEWCRFWIRRGLSAYEDVVQTTGGTFSIGDDVTWADACLIPQLYNARRFELDVAAFPKIAAIEANCFALPAFSDSHPDRQPDAVA